MIDKHFFYKIIVSILLLNYFIIQHNLLLAIEKDKNKIDKNANKTINKQIIKEITLKYSSFGKIKIYQPTQSNAKGIIFFFSGDGGWNAGVVDMAKILSEQDFVVVGINIVKYISNLDKSSSKCIYPAGDLENLSKFVQKKLAFKDYQTPILAGYSSGATLVYAILVQAPSNTFLGGLSLGFCPDIYGKIPWCRGSGLTFEKGAKGKGWVFHPVERSLPNWIVLQGLKDQVCDHKIASQFVAKIKNARLVELPLVGHGFSVKKNWLPQLSNEISLLQKSEFVSIKNKSSLEKQDNREGQDNHQTLNHQTLADALPTATSVAISTPDSTQENNDIVNFIDEMPLIEEFPQKVLSKYLVILYSGDGGWADIDKKLAELFKQQGVPVIGINSLKYFWRERTAESASSDLQKLISIYQKKFSIEKIHLVGYSFGADVLPSMINNLALQTKKNIIQLTLLGPSPLAQFEFKLEDWVSNRKEGLPLGPDIKKLENESIKIKCIYGEDEEEEETFCNRSESPNFRKYKFKGGHHFDGDIDGVFNIIKLD